MLSEVIGEYFSLLHFRVFHYVSLYSCSPFYDPPFHAAAVLQSQHTSDRIPRTKSRRRDASALSYFSTSNGTSSLAGATAAFRYTQLVYVLVFIDLPAAQAHSRSRLRNRVGDGMVPVIPRGGISVEVGRAYRGCKSTCQEIPTLTLAVAVMREYLRGSESWIKHTFGGVTPRILDGNLR